MKVYVIQGKYWNHDKCQCECKEWDNPSSCKAKYMWNQHKCDCVCNKAHKIDQSLDIKNCSCKNNLVH